MFRFASSPEPSAVGEPRIRVIAGDLPSRIGERIVVEGWLQQRRALGGVTFLILRDRSGTVQVVLDQPDLVSQVDRLQIESVIRVTGDVIAEPRARGGVEVRGTRVEVLSTVSDALPFEINKPSLKASLDICLDRAPLALRHASKRGALRVTARLAEAYRAALQQRDFVEIYTPKIVGTATEGGANVFPVAYFGRPAFLAQSPQLYKQIMVGVLERVFEIGPVFRAEPHATTRHLNEYVSLDLEFGFISSHRDVMGLIEALLKEMMEVVRASCEEELALHNATVPMIETIPIVTFHEAQEIVRRTTGEDCRSEMDLSPQQERVLGAWAQREHESDFLFVEGYPTEKRPFYTMPSPDDPSVSNSFDLLFRGLELVTGGQREHRYDRLIEAMMLRGIDPVPFEGYLDAFRFGMPPEGGCAFGLERFVAQLLGAGNIREVTAFPRDINRLEP